MQADIWSNLRRELSNVGYYQWLDRHIIPMIVSSIGAWISHSTLFSTSRFHSAESAPSHSGKTKFMPHTQLPSALQNVILLSNLLLSDQHPIKNNDTREQLLLHNAQKTASDQWHDPGTSRYSDRSHRISAGREPRDSYLRRRIRMA